MASKTVLRTRLKQLRSERKLTLREAAKKSGVSFTQIWMLETGASENPTLDTLAGLCKLYQTSIGYLLGEVD